MYTYSVFRHRISFAVGTLDRWVVENSRPVMKLCIPQKTGY